LMEQIALVHLPREQQVFPIEQTNLLPCIVQKLQS